MISPQSLYLSISLSLCSLSAPAAILCVGTAATGSGTGADWSNLLAWSATPVRGDTWYLADGSYAGKTLSVAASSTTLITILKATVAAHGGISTGWLDSMGDGQAAFTGEVHIGTSYWVFDGVSHGSAAWSTTSTDYGFYSTGLSYCVSAYNVSIGISNITFANMSAVAVGGDVEKFFCSTDGSTKSVHLVTISHCLLNGWQNAYHATSAGLLMDTWVFEYNVCINGFGSGGNHGEWINNNYGLMNNQITRYNLFKGPTSGFTGVIVANNEDNQNPVIYGNVFDGYDSGNGVITSTSAGTISGAVVYNNTFLNCGVSWLGSTASSGCVARNNLLYNMGGGITTGYTSDYNTYFSCSDLPTESNRQTGSGDPFIAYASNNYNLTSDTTAGDTGVSSAYRTDAYGNLGATRGAVQFVTAIPTQTRARKSMAPRRR